MNEEQRYLFDAFGYLIVRDAVSQAQVEELRATLQARSEEADPGARLEAPLHWSQAWRDLLDLQALSPLLEGVIGNHGAPAERFAGLPTFRIDHINVHTHVAKGFKGGILHGGWKSTGGSQFFRYHDGQFLQRPGRGGVRAVRHPSQRRRLLLHPRHPQGQSATAGPVAGSEPGHPPQRQAGAGRVPATPSCSPRR